MVFCGIAKVARAHVGVGDGKMTCLSVTRFQRQTKAKLMQKKGLEKVTGHTSAKHNGKHGSINSQFKTSYASVLNGANVSKTGYNSLEKKTISLSDHEMVQVTDSLEVVLVKDEEVLNDNGETSRGGDFNELFQEEQDWKSEKDKIEPENIGETIHSNVANNAQGKQTNQKTEEIKEVNGSDLSCPPGFEHLKNARKCSSSSSLQSKTSKCL
ncbi:hypothetical protein Tco_0452525 [Tanacetum coccineum]